MNPSETQRWLARAVVVVAMWLASCAAPPKPSDETVMFVAITGPQDQIARLYGVKGLDVQRRREEVGSGRLRVVAMLTRRSLLDELRRQGLAVEITKSEEATRRAIERDSEMMRAAHEQEAAKRRGGEGERTNAPN